MTGRAGYFSNRFRDVQALPLMGNITESSADMWGILIYLSGLAVFIITIISFTQIESLKTKNVFISTQSVGECETLSRLTAIYTRSAISTDPLSVAIEFFYSSQTFYTYIDKYFESPVGSRFVYIGKVLEVSYTNIYFSNYDDCIREISKGFYFYCVDGRDDIINVLGYCATVALGNTLQIKLTDNGFVMESVNNMYIDYPNITKLDVMKKVFTPDVVCSPFKYLPPYKCYELITASPLVILSNAFALASATIGILFTIVSTYFTKRSMCKSRNFAECSTTRDSMHGISVMQLAKSTT